MQKIPISQKTMRSTTANSIYKVLSQSGPLLDRFFLERIDTNIDVTVECMSFQPVGGCGMGNRAQIIHVFKVVSLDGAPFYSSRVLGYPSQDERCNSLAMLALSVHEAIQRWRMVSNTEISFEPLCAIWIPYGGEAPVRIERLTGEEEEEFWTAFVNN
jgi:hypothetical protein